MADDRLVTIANSLLINIGNGLETEGVNVPSHQYVHTGEAAFDFEAENCADAFIVTFAGLPAGTGPPDVAAVVPGTPVRCAVPLAATFIVLLLRCVPNLDASGRAPSASQLQTSGEELLRDSMTLPSVTVDLHLAKTLLPGECTLLGLGEVAPIGPQGNVGGTAMTLFVSLVGIP